MKILLLSDANSSHTQQWAIGLAERGLIIGIFSLRSNKHPWAKAHPNIKILYAKDQPRIPLLGLLNNFDLFTYQTKLTKIIQAFQPDLLHAHGVGNHGLVAAQGSRTQPLINSAWGSDIMAHPKKSFLHRYFVKYALKHSDYVLATSESLAKETSKYTSKEVLLSPFGIDVQKFSPQLEKNLLTKKEIVLGSVKGLKSIYQHHLSLQYFAEIKARHPDLSLRFLLVGDGNQRKALETLAKDLGILSEVTFTGAVTHSMVPKYLGEIDILLNLSERESFGVSVLEAAAMEIPVVAAKVGGLPEVVLEGITGFLIPAAKTVFGLQKIEELVLNATLRKKMGKAGRQFVLEKYSKEKCLNRMMEIYQKVLSEHSISPTFE